MILWYNTVQYAPHLYMRWANLHTVAQYGCLNSLYNTQKIKLQQWGNVTTKYHDG